MIDKKAILIKRLQKIESHYHAIKEYHSLIEAMLVNENIYNPDIFIALKIEKKAIFDAYLKRFSSLQDFLGAKIFPLLIDISGIGSTKMTEVLYHAEKEGLIDDLNTWISLREARNELEHDYPDDLKKALTDLKFCIDSFNIIESYYFNVTKFSTKYIKD
jgi:hypothetical protein